MDVSKIRNVVLISQNGSGKTSVAEAMLFTAKATSKLGKVDDGTSCLDFEPEERKRQISISAACHHLDWKKIRVYLIDTPGEDNFLPEAMMALRVADSAIFVVDAVDPVKPQTLKIWTMIREAGIPSLFFINKLDKERADFDKALDTLAGTLDVRAVPLACPIGTQENLKGVVDLVTMKGLEYPGDASGKPGMGPVPDDVKDTAENLQANLIEYAAESNDELLEKFLEGGELSHEEIMSGLRQGVGENRFIPVCCGSATKNIGVSNLLDTITGLHPSPDARGAVAGTNPKTGEEVERKEG